MRLFICEKPSQARDIANAMPESFKKEEGFLQGSDTVISWCFGHLLELAPPDDYCENLKPWRVSVLPVIPENWKLKQKDSSKKQLKILDKLLKKATLVVIATDADREGDVIGREVLDYFSYSGDVKRLWLSALDEVSVKKALADIRPGTSTVNLYQAGLGRARADWLMGMNLTMAVSSLFGTPGQGVLSVGRVQTPTLKLVVDRDKDIENFTSKDYFTLKARFKTGEHPSFWMNWEIPEELSDDEGRCIRREVAEKVSAEIKGKAGAVLSFEEKPKSQSAPLCLSLSMLQKIASAKYGFGAKEVLDLAQSLYETHKITSYPRTDCGYLPESQFHEAPQVLRALQTIDESLSSMIERCDTSYRSKVWNDKKITAHHGIIPTLNDRVRFSALTEKEKKLYDIIRRHYIAQFLGDYEYLARSAIAEVGNHTFKALQNTSIKAGWKDVLTAFSEEEGEEVKDELLPKLSKGQAVLCEASDIQSKKTKPPARFSEGTLITAMKSIAKVVDDPELKKVLKETAGIGTEATRANILETLINRAYIEKKGKQLISTKKGRELITLLPDSITNPATTALWEQELDNIAEGQGHLSDFLEEQIDTLEGMIEQLESLSKSKTTIGEEAKHHCPDCQRPMIRRKGKKGFWWGCMGYPDCKTTAFDEKGRPKFLSPSRA